MNLLFVMLQQQPGASSGNMILMILLMLVVFYFFMIRPQMKRQKELRKFQESLAKGDRVIVAGGIMGKIFDVKEDHAVIEVDDNVRIRVIKSSIVRDSSDLQQK